MLPLNHKRTTCSLAPSIFYVAKIMSIKRWKSPHCVGQMTTLFGKIQHSCLEKFSIFRVGDNEWWFFCQALCVCKFSLGAESLVKSSPWVNFINILNSLFLPTSFCQKITKPKCNREKLRKALSYEKCTHKMLMKSTPWWLQAKPSFVGLISGMFIALFALVDNSFS